MSAQVIRGIVERTYRASTPAPRGQTHRALVHVVVRQSVAAPNRVHLNVLAGCGIEGDHLAEQMRARLKPGTPVIAEGLYVQPMDAGGIDVVLRNCWSIKPEVNEHAPTQEAA